MSQIDTIYSTFDQLTTWEQYRDLLIETLTASGYQNLDDIIRSRFTEDHFDNPELLAQFIVPLFSPDNRISSHLYSGTTPFNLLTRIDRSRELVPNGLFDVDDAGWSTFNSSLSVEDGELVIEGSGSDGQAYSSLLDVTIGGLYRAQVSLRRGTATGSAVLRVNDGENQQISFDTNSTTDPELLSVTFIADDANARPVLLITGDGMGTIIADNVSLRRID